SVPPNHLPNAQTNITNTPSLHDALPISCVIPKKGRSLSLKELVEFLKAREIAKFKLPERLEILSDFPVSTFGKVSKKALVEMVRSEEPRLNSSHVSISYAVFCLKKKRWS